MAQATMWRTMYRVPDTLLSDTEESVLGTLWHQDVTSALVDILREAARRRGITWGVCNQIALLGLQHENGTAYDPRPDVMVLTRPLPSGNDNSSALSEAGVPLFVLEVASDSTVKNDIGDKRRAYEAIGVPEYIVFDPDADSSSPAIRAWHMQGGAYVPWAPDTSGLWRSASLDVSFEATQPFVSVFDRDGRKIELTHEMRVRAEYLEQRLDRFEQLEQRVDLYEREIVPRLAAAEQAVTEFSQRLIASEQARVEQARELIASEQARVEQGSQLVASEQARVEQGSQLVASEQARAEQGRQLVASEQARVEQARQLVASEQARLEAVQAFTDLSRQFTVSEQARAEQARQLAELEEQSRRPREQRDE